MVGEVADRWADCADCGFPMYPQRARKPEYLAMADSSWAALIEGRRQYGASMMCMRCYTRSRRVVNAGRLRGTVEQSRAEQSALSKGTGIGRNARPKSTREQLAQRQNSTDIAVSRMYLKPHKTRPTPLSTEGQLICMLVKHGLWDEFGAMLGLTGPYEGL